MSETGTFVFVGGMGVCRFEGTETVIMDGSPVLYNIYSPLHNDCNILIPAEGQGMKKVRALHSRDEIIEMIQRLPSKRYHRIFDERERKADNKRILGSGTCFEMLVLTENLRRERAELLSMKKKLRAFDAQALEEAGQMINDEFSIVLDIPPEQVGEFIKSVLDTLA